MSLFIQFTLRIFFGVMIYITVYVPKQIVITIILIVLSINHSKDISDLHIIMVVLEYSKFGYVLTLSSEFYAFICFHVPS